MKLLSHYMEQQLKMHPDITNWKNHIIDDKLSYSYRDTIYDRSTYPSRLHYHDYYELVVFETGNIKYVCDGCVYHPHYGDIILIPPGKFHMSVIDCDKTHYKRHVFYLYSSAFDRIGQQVLSNCLNQYESKILLTFKSKETTKLLMDLLERLSMTLDNTPSPLEEALGFSYIIQAFYLLNLKECEPKNESCSLPENILSIQRYIDQNFCEISSVSQVAEHFFYSREYVSRLFKQYFDTSISSYIMKRRIEKSQSLIVQDIPLLEISFQVGFGSLSTFIRAFRSVTNMTPSKYRKLRKELSS